MQFNLNAQNLFAEFVCKVSKGFKMIKEHEFIGKPVVLHDGQKLGSVNGVLLNADGSRLMALTLEGEKDNPRAVAFEGVNIGSDAVIVGQDTKVVALSDWSQAQTELATGPYRGREVLSTTGEHLGTLAELCFDEKSAALVGIDISKGALADLRGRTHIPSPGIRIGEKVLVEPEALLASQTVSSALNQVVSSLGTVVSDAGKSIKSVAREASNVIGVAGSSAIGKARNTLEANQLRFVTGRSVPQAFQVDEHLTIAPNETISEHQATRALDQGKLLALFLAAGGSSVRDSWTRAKDLAAQTLERLRGGSQTGQDSEPNGLEATLGFMVSRAVGDPSQPIIREGETVTADTILKANQERYGADLINAVFGEMNPAPSFEELNQPKDDPSILALDDDGNPNVQAEEESVIRSALGTTVNRPVFSYDGQTIVTPDQPITSELLEQARDKGVMPELSAALESKQNKLSSNNRSDKT
jgi:uncharacterized protein YrrD